MGGWVNGDQKGLSISLIFKSVKDNVYVLIYVYSKVATKILIGFKIWCQVWEWGHEFIKYLR